MRFRQHESGAIELADPYAAADAEPEQPQPGVARLLHLPAGKKSAARTLDSVVEELNQRLATIEQQIQERKGLESEARRIKRLLRAASKDVSPQENH